MNSIGTCAAFACVLLLFLVTRGETEPQAKSARTGPEEAKQAIIRFLTVHNKATTNEVAEWQAIPLAQVSSNKYTYGTYEIDLGTNYFGQMSWSLPVADMGDACQIAHGRLMVNSNGTWEAKAPSTCTFRMKPKDRPKDGQPPPAGDVLKTKPEE
jgi:hypothetical protein